MLAEIGLLMEETRSAHLHLEGLWRGVVSLDARLEESRKEREELVTGQARVESELRLAEQLVRQKTRPAFEQTFLEKQMALQQKIAVALAALAWCAFAPARSFPAASYWEL